MILPKSLYVSRELRVAQVADKISLKTEPPTQPQLTA